MPRRTTWRLGLLGLASAAVLAIVFLVPGSRGENAAFVPSREATMFPELDALLDAELEVVLAIVSEEAVAPVSEVPNLGDLTDAELETLLEEVEG